MAIRGFFGDGIIFTTSRDKIQTLKDESYSRKASYSSHKVLADFDKTEYTGTENMSYSFTMQLSYILGCDVDEMLETIDLYCRNGIRKILSFGGMVVGEYWVIESYTVKNKYRDRRGKTLECDVSVKLKEYR